MLNRGEDRIIMNKRIDKAEEAALACDCPEHRARCHAMYHSAIKKHRVRLAEGELALADEWLDCARAIVAVSELANPNIKFKIAKEMQ